MHIYLIGISERRNSDILNLNDRLLFYLSKSRQQVYQTHLHIFNNCKNMLKKKSTKIKGQNDGCLQFVLLKHDVFSKIVPKILRRRVQDTTSGFGIFTPSIPPFHCYLLIDIFYVDVIPTAHVG